MNKIDVKTKYGIVDNYRYSCGTRILGGNLYDSKDEAEKYIKEHLYGSGVVKEVAVLDGAYTPAECKADPIAVTTIKYKDFNGVIWETERGCELSNACIILNKLIGEDIFSCGKEYECLTECKISFCKKYFTIKDQSQIDALWVVFKWFYDDILKEKSLVSYRYHEHGDWEEMHMQLRRAKWIHKLNNIQKIFDTYGKVECKLRHYMKTGCYRGEDYDYEETQLLVKLNKTGVKFIANNPNDKTCNTCKYRGTDCGYTCKNSKPRCYVKATDEDISKRPEVYADSFDKQDVYDWNELFEYDFDVSKAKLC